MADALGLHEVDPSPGLGDGDVALATGAYRTPFRDEQRNAVVECRLGLVAQELAVRAGVEVQGVGDVGAADRGTRGHVYVLRPVGRADDDEVVGVDGADGVDHGLRIRLDGVAPRDVQRLVIDLVDDVIALAVGARHFLEEGDGLAAVVFGVMGVPVDDDVHVVGDGGIHDGLDTGLVGSGVLQVAAAFIHAHGHPHDLRFPVALQPAHGAGVVELLAAPSVVAPEQAVAGEAGGLAAGQHLVAAHGQRADVGQRGAGMRQHQRAEQGCGRAAEGECEDGHGEPFGWVNDEGGWSDRDKKEVERGAPPPRILS